MLRADQVTLALVPKEGVHVLLIEDDPDQGELVERMLLRSGGPRFSVHQARSLKAGLSRLVTSRVDVVLLDLGLPDSSGVNTFHRIKRASGAIPIVMLTGTGDDELVLEALRSGAQDYLMKGGIRGPELVRAVRHAIERSATQAKLRAVERNYRYAIVNNADAILVLDTKGVVQFCNPAAETLFNKSAAELLGMVFGLPSMEGDRAEVEILRPACERVVGEVHVVDSEWGGGPCHLVTVRDITVRKRMEEELRRTRDELEQRVAQRTADLGRLNAELRQFAYAASHDLRQPLRSILGFLGLLQRRHAGSMESGALRYVEKAMAAAKRMGDLLSGLLDYCRIEQHPHDRRVLDFGQVLKDTQENLSAAIAGSGAVITNSSLPSLEADPVQMVQLLQNLLGNAIKFSGDSPPRIHVSAHPALGEPMTADEDSEDALPSAWEFLVRDEGIGIAADSAERVFRLFERLCTDDEYEGTGIGLAICKKIVERHGGRIWVLSVPGGGATFHFTLPDHSPSPVEPTYAGAPVTADHDANRSPHLMFS